jgi:hypothetical protein
MTLPVTDNATSVPSDVMFGCAALATLPAVLAKVGVTAKLASN